MGIPHNAGPIPARLPSGNVIKDSFNGNEWASAFVSRFRAESITEESVAEWFTMALMIGYDRAVINGEMSDSETSDPPEKV